MANLKWFGKICLALVVFGLASCSSDNEDKKNTSYKNELNFSNNFNYNQL